MIASKNRIASPPGLRFLVSVIALIALMFPVLAVQQVAANPDPDRALIFSGHAPLTTSFSGFSTATGRELDTMNTLPADLGSYACVLLPGQSQPLTADEIGQLAGYVDTGGTVIAMAEWILDPDTINALNALLTEFGSSIQIEPNIVNFLPASTSEIHSSPYTEGVSSISYYRTSTLAVGAPAQTLVSVQGGTPLIAAEQFGQGVLVVSGDLNPFRDSLVIDPYSNEGNRVLAANLCQFRGATEPQSIAVDLKPYGKSTTIVAHSHKLLHLAVFGDGELDVSDLDLASLRLGPAMASPESNGGTNGKFKDENDDGYTDLKLTFRANELGVVPGQSEVCLTGSLVNGTQVSGCTGVIVKGK